ncbi:MAG: TonB-dependent receptor, partial [Bacteroidota bacterium]
FITFDGQYRDYGIKPNHIGSFFASGTSLQNTVSFSGGNKDANFRFSAGDTKMNDIVPNSGLHRNSFSIRGTMKMWDRLTVDSKATYIREDVNNRPYLGYSGANVALALMALPANFDQQWLKDSKTDENGNYIPWHSQSRITNPYYSLYDMENNSKKNRVMGYASFNYELTDWLTLRVKSGIDSYSYLYYDYSPISTPTRESGEMRELNSRTTEVNSEFLLTASKQLNEDWYASGSLGGNIMKLESKTTDIFAKGQVSDGLISINNYGDFNIISSNPHKQINSLYAFANVGYKDYLFADITARNDWSSTLPVDNNSYFYPSITTAFVFTQAFDIRSNLLSYGKFRASYAEVGGDTDPYNLSRSYRSYSYNMNGLPLTTNASNIMANPELKPSRTKGYEFGLDAKLFNWRVGMDITYYNQTTFDEIITLPTPPSMGHDYTYYNAGRINNKGVELMINIVPIKQEDVRWDLTLNGARNINKVVELHPEAKVQELARAEWVGSYIHAVEGEAYGDIIGYDFKRDPNGNVIVNANGLPVVSPELSAIGNGQYKFTGGITNTIRYKGFSFRALIDMKFGADILSMTNLKLYQYGVHSGTLEGREAWALSEQERVAAGVTSADWDATGGYLVNGVFEVDNGDGTFSYVENDSTYVNPRDYWSTVANNKIMSPFIYDASYVKFREMSLSYTLQENQLKALKYFKGATLSFVARNIWVIWTNVPNIDPESTYTISNGQGYEYASLPQRRSYGFNLKLNF